MTSGGRSGEVQMQVKSNAKTVHQEGGEHEGEPIQQKTTEDPTWGWNRVPEGPTTIPWSNME